MKPSKPTGTVVCPRCRRSLDPSCFYRDRSKASGRKSHCRSCTKSACQTWKDKHREAVADYARVQRRRNQFVRELLKAARPLNPLCEEDERTYRALVEAFGDEIEQFGIGLEETPAQSTPLNPIWLLYQAVDDLEDVTEYGFEDKLEMFLTGVFIHKLVLVGQLF